MKKTIAALACAGLGFVTLAASADPETFGVEDHSARALFYIEQPFGAASGRDSVLSFGLRLEKTRSELGAFDAASVRNFTAVPLGDLRFTLGGDYRFFAAGALMYDSEESWDSLSTEQSWHNGWFWLGAAVVTGGILCLTETWICKDNGRYNPPSPPDTEVPSE